MQPDAAPIQPENEAIANRTRLMSERIGRLAATVRASFKSRDPAQRVRELQKVSDEIFCDMLPVNSWLERKGSGEARSLFVARLHQALREAVECAGFDIPEYTRRRTAHEEPSPGAMRVEILAVFVRVFAAALVDLANDMEAGEGNPHAIPPEFKLLRGLAKKLGLKGKESEVIEALCDRAGRVRVADLAAMLDWKNPQDNWNSIRRRLNGKFKRRRHDWRFLTRDGNAVAEQLSGRK